VFANGRESVKLVLRKESIGLSKAPQSSIGAPFEIGPRFEDSEKLAVRFKQGLTIEEQKAVVESEPSLGLFSQREVSPTFRLAFLPLRGGLTEENVIQAVKRLNGRSEVEAACPMFDVRSGELVLTDEFIVKFVLIFTC